ncbi:hypothetical protein AC625_17415 [Peribacillus loiseleuriae]|uniref:Uncharacterized protein n=1 Tax=Peribacillus loiseleuriae TaxID=1679170 RepID=A0A0K9GWL7_9BACI|nr:hypothetical protein AC625_17415 [Peribacillus loiseleuriae]
MPPHLARKFEVWLVRHEIDGRPARISVFPLVDADPGSLSDGVFIKSVIDVLVFITVSHRKTGNIAPARKSQFWGFDAYFHFHAINLSFFHLLLQNYCKISEYSII